MVEAAVSIEHRAKRNTVGIRKTARVQPGPIQATMLRKEQNLTQVRRTTGTPTTTTTTGIGTIITTTSNNTTTIAAITDSVFCEADSTSYSKQSATDTTSASSFSHHHHHHQLQGHRQQDQQQQLVHSTNSTSKRKQHLQQQEQHFIVQDLEKIPESDNNNNSINNKSDENENVPTVDMIDGQFFIAWPSQNTMKAYDNIAAKVGVKSTILGSESIVSMLPERRLYSQHKRFKLTTKTSSSGNSNSNNTSTASTTTVSSTPKQRSHQKTGQSVSDKIKAPTTITTNTTSTTTTTLGGTSKYAQQKPQQQHKQLNIMAFNGSKITRSSSSSSSSSSSNSNNNVCKESTDTNYCEQTPKPSSNNCKTLPSHHHHNKKARPSGHKHPIGSTSLLPPLTPMKIPTKRSIDCDSRVIDNVPDLKVVTSKHPNAHKYEMKIVKIIKDPSLTLDWDQLQLLYDDMILLSKPPLIGEYPSPMLPPYPDIISTELAELCVTSLEPTFTPQPVKRFQVTDDDDSDVESSLYDDWDLLALHDPSAIKMEFSMR